MTFEDLARYTRRRPDRFYIRSAMVWTILVVAMDFFTGHRVRFAPFYLPSVFVIGWFVPVRRGIWLCLGITLLWFAMNQLSGPPWPGPAVLAWNFCVRFLAFAAFYGVVVILRRERAYALSDPMTGVANRRAFTASATHEMERSRRMGTPLTLAYLDVDDFKQLNDRWGHLAGDQTLRYVASAIANHLRASDLIARLGGDEFAVLLPEMPAEAARHALQDLKAHLDRGLTEGSCPATVSVGAVTFEVMPDTVASLLQQADRMMYETKKSGKNAIRFLVWNRS